ncbi:MAG: CBS domain-containing protein [Planctomycetota bacterium]
MLVCPYCGAENIEGMDACDSCQQALTDLSIRVPISGVEAGLLRDRVSQLPVHKPIAVDPSTPVGEVLREMVDDRIGCVLIVRQADPDTLVGIFSERDALMKLNVDAPKWLHLPVEQFMTPNPAVVPSDAKIAYALHKMNIGGYRHLPVLVGTRPVSVISMRDLLRYLTERATSATLGGHLLGGPGA